MKLSYLILRILFGLVFIVSACLKLAPIEAFEMVLIKQVGISWSLAPLMARSLILFELVLGTSIAFGFWTRAMVMAAQAMTAGFTVYLTLLIVQGSGDDNCGCFGELIPMDAPTSIVKNIIILIWGQMLLWKLKLDWKWRFSWIGLVLGLLVVPILFLASPIPSGNLDKEPTIDNELVTNLSEDHEWDLDQGEKLIVVMYANCVHCKQLATLLSTTDKEIADEKLRLMIFGNEEKVAEFLMETKVANFPFQPTSSRALMIAVDGTFPTAILLKDGQVVSNWTGKEVNMDLLSTILSK
ncbi:MAG: DoxX family protein [Flavobacteriales bacterium]|nr:DoxX family protein [Flavobacteriales bacterium]